MSTPRHVFILRIWSENDGLAQPGQLTWRGSLQAANAEQIQYFDSPQRLLELVCTATGWNAQPPPENEQGTR